jgi:hypothetical protein
MLTGHYVGKRENREKSPKDFLGDDGNMGQERRGRSARAGYRLAEFPQSAVPLNRVPIYKDAALLLAEPKGGIPNDKIRQNTFAPERLSAGKSTGLPTL